MRALAVARRILDQMRRDPRTLALIFLAPVFIVFLLHEVVTAGDLRPRIAVAGSESVATSLEKGADVLRAADRAAVEGLVASGEADASIYLDEGEGLLGPPPQVTLDAADPSASAASIKAIREALTERAQSSLPAFAKAAAKSAIPEIRYVSGSASTTTFDFLAPVLLCFLVFFFTFILSGIAFLRERSSGTLERAFASPIRRRDLVLGYMVGFGAVAAVQTALLQAFIVGVYSAPNASGFVPALIVNLSVAFCALAMGLFLSAYANSEFQMLQFIPIVIVPQILFAGIFNLRSGGAWMKVVSYLFPLTYAGEALRDLMVRGRPLGRALPDIAILLGFGAAFLALAVAGLGRYRKDR
jgi:ABC-type multidrug transport system, permease component